MSELPKKSEKPQKAVANDDLLAALNSWGSIAHDDKGGFMERFCPMAWILTQVSWDSENMRFVYILRCGQHVADSVKITEWLEFLSANNEALEMYRSNLNYVLYEGMRG